MNVPHRLTGYDKRTELLTCAHDVPRTKEHFAREVAGVLPRDPDAVGSYPLGPEQARRIASVMGARVDIDHYDWFFEPRAAEALRSDRG